MPYAAAVPTPSPVLVFLIGPAAVGKMGVGVELAARTGLRLFHNHQDQVDRTSPSRARRSTDDTQVSPADAAQMVVAKFGLPTIQRDTPV